jgi:hypothetical protein
MISFSELAPADQEAIGKTLLTLLKAFDERDAEPLRGVYSENADWVNAVGGGTLDRDNFSLRASQRQDDGTWLIVSEMFQDANTETTYQH